MIKRIPAGRVNGVHAPEGTILGPKEVTREFVVITDNDEAGVTVGYATVPDLDLIASAATAGTADPHSVAEARALITHQAGERRRFVTAILAAAFPR